MFQIVALRKLQTIVKLGLKQSLDRGGEMDEISLAEFHCLDWKFPLIISVCTQHKILPVETILIDMIEGNN